MKLWVKKYSQEGDLQHTYSALRNKMEDDNSLVDFNTDELSIDLNHPLNVECQPSYDGTVNLIINDDINPPRIINSRFTKIEDNRYRIINRNQKEQTNIYKKGYIDLQTRLFRNLTKLPKLYFVEQNYFGQLKGGNYTFYIKFADSDYNQTDIVCESGQVSVFKGNLFDVASISGTLQDERTDKSIKFKLTNIDQSFSKFYIYYTREYSDTNGFRLSETKKLTKPYDIKGSSQDFIINGFEEEELISATELNIQYNYVNNVKTQAQVQNMLFFGNIENTLVDYKNLQNLSLFFDVELTQKQESIGWINPENYYPEDDDFSSMEYYNPRNIYYNLGYWPDEIYRLGVVYIMNDDSLSPVFNLRGCVFEEDQASNRRQIEYKIKDGDGKYVINYLERDSFLTGNGFVENDNSYGVFKNHSESATKSIFNYDKINKKNTVKPWYYKISMPNWTNKDWNPDKDITFKTELKKYGVKGYFFVRQKRIPITICQGYSVGIDTVSFTPILYTGDKYISESFLGSDCSLSDAFGTRMIETKNKFGNALLSLDANVHPVIQSHLDGSRFVLQKVRNCTSVKQNKRNFTVRFSHDSNSVPNSSSAHPCVFVGSDTPYIYVNGYSFSTRAGVAESVKEFSFFDKNWSSYPVKNDDDPNHDERTSNLKVRGIYSPIVGVCGNIQDNAIYNVKIQNYSTNHIKDYINIRANDNSAFYAISDRFGLDEDITSVDVYRGDCYTNTVSIRLNRNFSDPDYPISDTIIDSTTWKEHYGGYLGTNVDDKGEEENYNWAKINRGDINSVPLGMWVTYKCLSSYNLGLRAEDRSYPEEMALYGNSRSFYPLHGASIKSANKIEESWLLNDGYSATVGQKTNITAPNLPYVKDQFDNRIMFSNVQVDGDFRNAYRVFQGLSHEDLDRQYGAIVKLIPWGANLFCVFEHGLGIIPINEKALIQTTTEQSVHMYGAGVLQKQITLISSDFGSIWPESVIRTPIGIYGVDTYAKKIWRFSSEKGLETISDMKIQRFLNDNIILSEMDKYPIVGLKNVKTHFNNNKGDVMFTFYNFSAGKEWNFCYNERMAKWITRYSWTPLYSENINNIFYSMDKKRSEILGHIYDNKHCTYGIQTSINEWKLDNGVPSNYFETEITLTGVQFATGYDLKVNSIKSSYILNGVEYELDIPAEHVSINSTQDPLVKKLGWYKMNMHGFIPKEVGYDVPLYYKIDVTATPEILGATAVIPFNRTIGIVVDYHYNQDLYDDLLINGFYVHGRAGIFNEISYEDENTTNQITPTKWYEKQEPFEFEFVVNNEVGLHKIFENLVIISNRVQPKSFEFEITGDVYSLFKEEVHPMRGAFSKERKKEFESEFINVRLVKDEILNQHHLVVSQECKDMEKFGRRLGNIHYKEDSWYVTIDPIKFKTAMRNRQTTRIRDKYLKVRVKYSGEDLAIITALKTITNITHS